MSASPGVHSAPRQRLLFRRRTSKPRVILGLVLLASGLAAVSFVGWQYLGTNIVAQREQSAAKEALLIAWDAQHSNAGHDESLPGDAVALVRIPRFDEDYEMPLLHGAGDDEFARGIGWFPETARPGEYGNFVIAAHRVTNGEPFRNFPDLRAGDPVIVETRTHIFTYILEEDGDDRVIDFDQTWILDPVPGSPDAKPDRAMITLITCASLFQTADRNVVTGYLRTTELKS